MLTTETPTRPIAAPTPNKPGQGTTPKNTAEIQSGLNGYLNHRSGVLNLTAGDNLRALIELKGVKKDLPK